MSLSPGTRIPLEVSYQRHVLFAIELLDAVTLERISQGIKVIAEGLEGKPIVNSSGLFVWLEEDITRLRKVRIVPGALPYEGVERPADELARPLATIELSPRVDYPFGVGVTGLLGSLVEEKVPAPGRPTPVLDAEIRLRWVDQDNVWHEAPTPSHTAERRGDFAAIIRLGPAEVPKLDDQARLIVRLRASRGAAGQRDSPELKLSLGRVAEPSTLDPLIFAWDELQP
jgi:hypothetical protein